MNSTQIHTNNLTHPKYREDIDGLRAVAILVVVTFHAFPALLSGGFIGVDIFFVISGFLISTIIFDSLDHNRFSFTQFYARRIKRIFPALIVVLLACYVIGCLFLTAPDFKRLGKHIVGGAAFISNFFLLKESGYFDAAAEVKELVHLWSLSIEEQFYIVWPVLAWCAWKCRFKFLLLVLATGLAFFFLNIRTSHDPSEIVRLYYSPLTRFWELSVGAALACINLYRPFDRRINFYLARSGVSKSVFANFRACVGTGLVLSGFFCISKDKPFPGWYGLLPTIGTALIISAGAQAWVNRRILANRLLVWFGLISFPLYLWHWPLLSFARVINTATPDASLRVALVVLSIVLAWLTRVFVENPIRFGSKSNYAVPALAILMFLIGCLGYITFSNEGLPQRYGVAALQIKPGRYECRDREKNSGCEFGNSDSKKFVVVWGDSHAEQYTDALRVALGSEYRFLAITNGSCFMGEKVVFPDIGDKHDCSAAIEKIKSLRGRPIYAVIRAQRWHGYGVSEKSDVERAVNDAITAYDLHPQKIIIMGATPDVDIECEISNYYSRSLFGKKVCKQIGSIDTLVRSFITTTKAMGVPSDVYFIYPFEIVCPNEVCTVVKGNVAYFEDTHHLSRVGALLVVPAIARVLADDDSKSPV